MFYFRINKLRIVDNRENRHIFRVFGDDLAEIKISSFVSTEETRLPEIDELLLTTDERAKRRLVASAILEKAGYTVAVAQDGRKGVEAARRLCPDVILMDLQMPVMDGYDALAAIRALPAPARHVPIIALTANVLARSDAEQRQLEFDGYLAKPLSRSDLLAVVSNAMPTLTSRARQSA